MTKLLEAAQRPERCYSQSFTCADCLALPIAPAAGAFYELCGADADGFITVSAYQLVAVPHGTQASDIACGKFILNHTGARSVSGTSTNCW